MKSPIFKSLLSTWLFLLCATAFSNSLPRPALVAYWENWRNLKLTDFHDNVNVIQLAFAVTEGSSLYEMDFNLPGVYNTQTFMADIDILHSQGKKVILSIGGANDPVFLANTSQKDTFVSSMLAILARFDYKIDGIDLDLEGDSYDFASNWTMSSPANGQLLMIEAVEEIMEEYSNQTGKHLILTMAPEIPYLTGGMSSYTVNASNGGAMLPILEALSDSLDLIHPQFYNAVEAYGIDNRIYRNYTVDQNWQVTDPTGLPSFVVAGAEAMIVGFNLQAGKGSYSGIPEEKLAIGLPASECDIYSQGWLPPQDTQDALRYLMGEISKPSTISYTLRGSYPNIGGLMTWSGNEDSYTTSTRSSCSRTPWEFADNFEVIFPAASVSTIETQVVRPLEVMITQQRLNVSSEYHGETFQLFQLDGQLVSEFTMTSQGLNLQNYSTGHYLLQSQSGLNTKIQVLE